MGLTPTRQEYLELYPERLKAGRIYCECGASNIRNIHEPAVIGDLNICAVCNKALYIDRVKR